MASYITSIGTATPRHRIEQTEVIEFLLKRFSLSSSKRQEITKLFKNTGINHRYSVLPDFSSKISDMQLFSHNGQSMSPSTEERMAIYRQQALPLAIRSVEKAFQQREDEIEQITHLITVSCTGLYAPGLDIDLVKELELSSQVSRTGINYMGCYAAVNALKVADSICRANPEARVLIVCIELCSLHFQNQLEKENLVATALFGDGAASVIIEPQQRETDSLRIESFYEDIIPDSEGEMVWKVGNVGFELTLSAYVPATIRHGIERLTSRLFAQSAIDQSEVDLFALHPGGRKIMEVCEEKLGITPKANRFAYRVLENYGNMSSPTILFVLNEILKDPTITEYEKTILGVAFGPGLTLESVLLTRPHV